MPAFRYCCVTAVTPLVPALAEKPSSDATDAFAPEYELPVGVHSRTQSMNPLASPLHDIVHVKPCVYQRLGFVGQDVVLIIAQHRGG